MVIVILLVLGLCFGSFVNALVWRFRRQAELRDARDELQQVATPPNKSKKAGKQGSAVAAKTIAAKSAKLQAEIDSLSIAKGRSMCVHCQHELAARDLIPVVSYIWLRGKCRYCGRPIQDTPLAELLTPALFIVSYVFWPLELSGAGLFVFIAWLVFLVGFVALSIYDLRWFELPHRIVLPLIGLALVAVAVEATVFGGGMQTVWRALWGAVVGGGIFYALYMFSPKQTLDDGMRVSKWIGFGDITLGTLLGLLVGGPANAFLFIFMASLIGTVVAVPLLASGRATRGSHLPFGPFLMAGAVIVKLWGASLIAWYLGNLIV
jgi:prepilin signal peptidase PulO-like enzyme (type II secretory pathway)